ncbi:MAG: LUD domain-containing protein [Planctomyces sp.]|nr:LUD domain-containing protein [Planctomyces sp.]
MTTSRDELLARIRSHAWDGPELPSLDREWSRATDLRQQFTDVLAGVGGRCLQVASLADAEADLQSLTQYAEAPKTVSLVPGVGRSTFDLSAVVDPHDLEDVDFAVLPGDIAVAENGAVWVTDAAVPQRVLFFLPQHLALVVPAAGLVGNLHEGQARATLGERPFGCWMSGPSKTADIEQALVIGAHGARSLTVYLVG